VMIGVTATAWLGQDRLVFFPQPLAATGHLPARAEPLEVVAADGTRLRGWMLRGTSVPAAVVIYFGGNAEEVSWTVADDRWPDAWSIVALNYRGYGASEGAPGEPVLLADGIAIYDAVVRRADVDRQRIVAFGRSLGTAVATRLAAERPLAGVVLASPFDSLAAVGQKHYPWLPVSLLLRHRFETLADARRSHVPLLAIVAAEDSIVPPERSRALFDAWAGPKAWQLVPGADHNTLGADDAFWEGIANFLGER
jgi:pimeloyl-ACP methyl ester carboxylesterase